VSGSLLWSVVNTREDKKIRSGFSWLSPCHLLSWAPGRGQVFFKVDNRHHPAALGRVSSALPGRPRNQVWIQPIQEEAIQRNAITGQRALSVPGSHVTGTRAKKLGMPVLEEQMLPVPGWSSYCLSWVSPSIECFCLLSLAGMHLGQPRMLACSGKQWEGSVPARVPLLLAVGESGKHGVTFLTCPEQKYTR
jgi:hypothetical protein